MPAYIHVQPGDKFGKLTVLEVIHNPGENRKCKCKCECGAVVVRWKHNLTNGNTQSCGCHQKQRASEARTTHGHTVGSKKGSVKTTPTYKSWASMKGRVRFDKGTTYTYFGVSMDPRWMEFENFLADMGERPEGTTLDRDDNDKGYWPGNCAWRTPREQSQNRRPWKHSPEGLARITRNLPTMKGN